MSIAVITTRARDTALALAVLIGAVAGAQASPCAQPSEYTRAAAVDGRAPLVRPFIVAGMPVLALQQRGGAAWLELAVDSESSARRLLGAGTEARVSTQHGAVLLACDGLDASLVARAPASRSVATALW